MWSAVYQQQWQVQDFPESGGTKPKGGGGYQPIILAIFSENYIKLEKNWIREVASLIPPLRSATEQDDNKTTNTAHWQKITFVFIVSC